MWLPIDHVGCPVPYNNPAQYRESTTANFNYVKH